VAARARPAVKAVTPEASGLQLSSGFPDADIGGMRAALLAATLLPAAAFASTSSRVTVSAVVLPAVRISEEVGPLVRKAAAPGGTLYVLPIKGSASSSGGGMPSLSIEGAALSLRHSSPSRTATAVDGDLRVFVPQGSGARVVVTVLTDGAPPDVRTGR
jgi:hypothetical protein